MAGPIGFLGEAENTLDGKGRLAVPAPMRRAMNPEANDTFVAVRGFEPCVMLYPLDEWQKISARLRSKNGFVAQNRAFVRSIARRAEPVALDSQGRVSLSKSLIEYASLEPGAKATVLGAITYLEVWSPALLDEQDALDDPSASLAEQVMGEV